MMKMVLKACFSPSDTIDSYPLWVLLSYRTIPHTNRMQSRSSLIGRQIRSPKTMSYSTNEKYGKKKDRKSSPEKGNFIAQKRHSTVIITSGENLLAHSDQIRPRIDVNEIKMEEEEEEDDPERDENMSASGGEKGIY